MNATLLKGKRRRTQVVLLVSLVFSALLTIFTSLPGVSPSADSNIATWVMCSTEDGRDFYNAATTDLIPYKFRSKSTTAKMDKVDSLLNSILMTAGFDFNKTNKAILGRGITANDKEEKEESTGDKKETKPNGDSTKKVSAFDRFGVAGLFFSSYGGEWKYYETDGCKDQEEASTTEFGKFYAGRKEPKASFNEIPQSKDPRVNQYNKGLLHSWTVAFSDNIVNVIFYIPKIIVTLTIAFIGYTFSDVSSMIGLTGGTGVVALFNNLYSNFFTPLVEFTVILTAIYFLYMAVVKRQFRKALINGLGQTIICLLLAFVISSAPSYWITLPTKATNLAQSLVIFSMGDPVSKEGKSNSLCTITTKSSSTGKNTYLNGDYKARGAKMDEMAANMKSTIGCRLWQEFLFNPWVKGQFGDDFDSLNAGKTGISNDNKKWVGKPSVPLGGGEVVNNWALFQLSTQTNVHAPINEEGKISSDFPQLIDGVPSDWWRVADALSNYEERTVTKTPVGGAESVTADEQVKNNPMPQWNSWVGNTPGTRYGVALMAIGFSILGSIGPLVFSLLSAIYGVGLSLIMAVSPIFLLLGTWGGGGQQIFRGWLTSLLSTMIKKVATTVLFLISFSITISSLDMVEKVGWVTSFTLLSLATYILIRNKGKILAKVSKVNIGGVLSPDAMIKSGVQKVKGVASPALSLTGASLYGGLRAMNYGVDFRDGMNIAAEENVNQLLRRSQFGRQVEMTRKELDPNSALSKCVICGDEVSHFGYMDRDNNVYCPSCASDLGLETRLAKVELGKMKKKKPTGRLYHTKKRELKRLNEAHAKNTKNTTLAIDDMATRKELSTSNSQWLSYEKLHEKVNVKVNNGLVTWDNRGVELSVASNLFKLEGAIVEYEELWKRVGANAIPPSVPEPIEDYVQLSTVNTAWRAGDYDLVRELYSHGWERWHSENGASVENVTLEDIESFEKVIRKVDYKAMKESMESSTEYLELKRKMDECPSTPEGKGKMKKYQAEMDKLVVSTLEEQALGEKPKEKGNKGTEETEKATSREKDARSPIENREMDGVASPESNEDEEENPEVEEESPEVNLEDNEDSPETKEERGEELIDDSIE